MQMKQRGKRFERQENGYMQAALALSRSRTFALVILQLLLQRIAGGYEKKRLIRGCGARAEIKNVGAVEAANTRDSA